MRLDGADEQTQIRPLPNDELVQLQRCTQEARVASDLAGKGHGLARAACETTGASAGLLERGDPVLMGWTPPPDGIAMCHGGDVEIATEEGCPWKIFP